MDPREQFEGIMGTYGTGKEHATHENIEHMMKSFKDVHLLVAIVSRHKGKRVTEILQTKHMPGQFVFYAEGTASSSLSDMLGLGSIEKAVTLGFVRNKMIPSLLEELDESLRLTKKATGVAFSIPLSGMMIPPMAADKDLLLKFQQSFESEVDHMNTNIDHDLIVVMVDEGQCEEVMDAARSAGATGGTTFHALHFGMQQMANLFGIPMHEKKDIVAILAKRELKTDIMCAIKESTNVTHKVMFTLPADNVIGIVSPKKDKEKEKE